MPSKISLQTSSKYISNFFRQGLLFEFLQTNIDFPRQSSFETPSEIFSPNTSVVSPETTTKFFQEYIQET